MKTTGVILMLLLLATSVFSQQETLFSGEIDHGGFGGPVVKFSSINGKFGVLVGGRGGWIIDHKLMIGGGGYGLANYVAANRLGPLNEKYLDFGYGGLEIEWVVNSDKLLHFSFHTLIGAGAIQYRNEARDITFGDMPNDALFVLEPGATLDLNVTTWFRLSAGASYRYITGVEEGSRLSSNQDLSGPSAILMLRFGKF
ncbi:MAG: hypothetical protein ONB13_09860 [candidate division KSB1 bacterium]|nr:hypothetical protein [candidate division KSB1 bacterium]MDZ7357345.1 hypothetical protein [candidate division KSB1 bacterium]MDZ7376912.1 hypothetical protein [candidate division KSB1 bacterium]